MGGLFGGGGLVNLSLVCRFQFYVSFPLGIPRFEGLPGRAA